MRKLDIVLVILVVVSLILNGILLTGSGLLLQRALKLRRAAVGMLNQATVSLTSLEQERVEYPVHVQQNVPVVADVPIQADNGNTIAYHRAHLFHRCGAGESDADHGGSGDPH